MTDKRYGWPTTRRFPRTMKDAFPNDPENAQWFFPPERKQGKVEIALLAIGIWMWIGLAYYFASR